MFNLANFITPEYKKCLLDAETHVKSLGFKEVTTQDVFIETTKLMQGPVFEMFNTFGINEKVTLEVLSQEQFEVFGADRKGEFLGISPRFKEILVASMKIAASYKKGKAGIEDFVLALLKNNEYWTYRFFDYLGVNPKDIEQHLHTFNANINKDEDILEPISSLLNALEEGIGQGFEDMGDNPFFANKKQAGKSESSTPALDFFGIDLTQEAQNGKIDPIIGRDSEIERLISVLNRKTKNNPCLVGDPGVGKTAVVEGLARRISSGDVPFAMQGKRIVSVDLGSMIAGTKYRGEFENRIKQIIDEASKLENEVILFIDEIHTIIGAGAGEGSLDAANILKPAMGRGKICIIGATTATEYQKHIEKDSALERRFQKIEVDEPTEQTSREIITGLRSSFEEYHNLIIEDDAIEAAVDLSVRYLTDRFLPDKAIDLIDEACSAKSMKYNFDEKEIKEIKLEIEALQKKINEYLLAQNYEKAIEAKAKQGQLETKIKEKKAKVSIPRQKRLHIRMDDIQRIVNQITDIPLENLQTAEGKRLLTLDKRLKAQILGQDEAIDTIVKSIKRSRVGIADRNRPIGSFLFLGPTGVGKTELVKVLAKEFYDDPKALIKIDMSELSERHSASKLIGTTPGYVWYEEGGMLTERVRRKPYSIVLFDEMEKGSVEAYNLLLQIMEDGVLTDGKGRKINFKNTIIIMTSNIGGEEFTNKATLIGFDTSDSKEAQIIQDYEKTKAKILESLPEYFLPEFINRIDKIVVFNPIDKKVLKKIILLEMDKLIERLKSVGVALEYDDKSVQYILKESYKPEFGARVVRRYLQDHLEDQIADMMISKKITEKVTVSATTKVLLINGHEVWKK